jgi:hypothetical protein
VLQLPGQWVWVWGTPPVQEGRAEALEVAGMLWVDPGLKHWGCPTAISWKTREGQADFLIIPTYPGWNRDHMAFGNCFQPRNKIA